MDTSFVIELLVQGKINSIGIGILEFKTRILNLQDSLKLC